MAKKDEARPDGMMSVLNDLRKTFGEESVFSGDDVLLEKREGISTGSYALDDAIGILGFPRGRITQLAGAEASGKTFLALQGIKSWQAQNPNNWAVWIDAEFSFNSSWAEQLGLDLKRIMIIKENYGDVIFNQLCGIPNKDKPNDITKKKQGLLDKLIAQGVANTCGIIVLDSIACIIPPVEATYNVGHQNMAPMARFLPAALRRISPMLEKTNIAFIAINQLRVDPGVQYGNPEGSPGGRALKHACRLMINMAKSFSAEKKILDADDKPIGHTVLAKIQKNSFAIPRDAEFVIRYIEGIGNKNIEMLDLGIKYNIIERPNNTSYVYGETKWVGRKVAEEALKDEKLFAEIWEKVKYARENSLVGENKTATKEMLGLDNDQEETE